MTSEHQSKVSRALTSIVADYHVFKEGELEDLVRHASQRFPDIEVRHELGGWEKGNWFGIWQCIRR